MHINDADLAEIRRLHASLDAVMDEAQAAGSEPSRDLMYPLIDAIDALVEPLARAAGKGPDVDLKYLIEVLPNGFYRSELRTLLAMRARDLAEGRSTCSPAGEGGADEPDQASEPLFR
jgi:hypothetical protein